MCNNTFVIVLSYRYLLALHDVQTWCNCHVLGCVCFGNHVANLAAIDTIDC